MNIFELLSCCFKTYCPLLTLTRPYPDIITDPMTRDPVPALVCCIGCDFISWPY